LSLAPNYDAERAVLGAILLDNAALTGAVKFLHAGDFLGSAHQKVFRRMLALREAGQPIDLVTLINACAEAHDFGAEDGTSLAYIAQLADGMPHVTNVEFYAEIVRKQAVKRRLGTVADKLSRAVEAGDDISLLQKQMRELTAEQIEPLKVVGGNGHLSYSLTEFLQTEFPEPDQLIQGLIGRGGTAIFLAMPHHLKSWFTLALGLSATTAGTILGRLEVKTPVRTLLVHVEDPAGQVQWRMRQLLRTGAFSGVDAANFRVIPRCNLQLPDDTWYQALLREVETFRADHLILDVVRRIFRGDINSQKDTTPFLEQLDRLREATNVATTLVHHENRKEADLMYASAGSYTLPSWAWTLAQFKRKVQDGPVSHVEIEVDCKMMQSAEPMRMVLDLTSETPVRLEAVEDLAGVDELRQQLGVDWTVRDFMEVLDVTRTAATRRLKKFLASGVAEKITGGKRGRTGGLARYGFVGENG